MKVYLAGKITGDPNYREKFRGGGEEAGGAGRCNGDFSSICLSKAGQVVNLSLTIYQNGQILSAVVQLFLRHDYRNWACFACSI